jgi:hypothetical protein
MNVREILEWSLAHLEAAEAACDQAANLAAAANDPAADDLPDLTKEERELESLLISRLECRPGGLDPKTPSRTRAWLWCGLAGIKVEAT